MQPGSLLLWAAAILLLGLAGAQGYVSYRAQYAFVFAAKHVNLPSMLEALGLDTGAIVFAVLGLAHARMRRPARIERALNIACALGSMTMNLLGADLASPRSIAVYVLPAVLYAAGSDRLIATAAVAAGVPEASVWRALGHGALYGLRLLTAFPSTTRGLRLRLLLATPLPVADKPGTTAPTTRSRQRQQELTAPGNAVSAPAPATAVSGATPPEAPATGPAETEAASAPSRKREPAPAVSGSKVRSIQSQRDRLAELVELARLAEKRAGRRLKARELQEELRVSTATVCKVAKTLREAETVEDETDEAAQ